jgi:hypothetical protein
MLWNASAWKRESFSMNIQPDFKDFLRLLETHQVDYMIVGGYAVAFHGFPRFTKDIDIFFDVSAANIDRLRLSLWCIVASGQRRFPACQLGQRLTSAAVPGRSLARCTLRVANMVHRRCA